ATDVELVRRRFTVDEYHRMGEAGILNEDDRVELVRGEIVQMSPIGIQHAACGARLTEILLGRLRGRATLWPQNPLTILSCSLPPTYPTYSLTRTQHTYKDRTKDRCDDLLFEGIHRTRNAGHRVFAASTCAAQDVADRSRH